MDIPEILRVLDEEIVKLQQARQLLSSSEPALAVAVIGVVKNRAAGKRRGRPIGRTKPPARAAEKRTISEEGRASIAAAQKKRWGATKKTGKFVASTPATKSAFPAKSASAVRTAAKKAILSVNKATIKTSPQ